MNLRGSDVAGGEPGGDPASVTADEIGHTPEAETMQVGCREARRVAIVADDDEPRLGVGDPGVAVIAAGISAPFEEGPRYVHGAGNRAFALAVLAATRVDQHGA